MASQSQARAAARIDARLRRDKADLFAALKAIHQELVRQDIKFGPLIADAEAALVRASGEPA